PSAPTDPAPPADSTPTTPTDTAPPATTTDGADDTGAKGNDGRSAVRPHPSGIRSGAKDRSNHHPHSTFTTTHGGGTRPTATAAPASPATARAGHATRGGEATASAAGAPATPAGTGTVPGTADVTPLLPTPEQLRFSTHAAKIKPLPNLESITHRMAVRLV